MRFVEKVCIVTGGGSGIGRATCQRLAAEGGRVVVADVDPGKGQETVQLIARAGSPQADSTGSPQADSTGSPRADSTGSPRADSTGSLRADSTGSPQAVFARCDVSSSADVQATVKLAVDRWGRIDVLVNNAAMMTFKKVVDLSESDWDRVMAVNLKSVFMFCKYAIPHVPQGGAIVNVSSVHAHESEPGVSPYAASKGGMEAFVRVLALELEAQKIRVNCVAPGAVNTPMLWNNPNVKDGEEKVTGAIGQPEDLAAAICFLASSEARFVNGTTLIVDGARLDIL